MKSDTSRERLGRLLLALFVLVVGPQCMIDRSTRLRVDANGQYNRVYDRHVSGCDGGFDRTQIQQQVGGSIGAQFEHESGMNAGSELSVVYGSLSEHRGFDTEPSNDSYFMGALSVYGGYDFQNLGMDLGVMMVFADGQTVALPSYTLRVGSLGKLWAEFGIFDPHFQPLRLIHGSLRVRDEWMELRAGAAIRSQWLVDLYDDTLRWSEYADEGVTTEGSLFGELAVGPFDGWGGKLMVDVNMKSPSVMLGVFFQPDLSN